MHSSRRISTAQKLHFSSYERLVTDRLSCEDCTVISNDVQFVESFQLEDSSVVSTIKPM